LFLSSYNEIIYRLIIGGAELSFHYTELASVKGADLVRFVKDCFRCTQSCDIYPWPLFFKSGKWKKHYAWTEVASSAGDR